MQRNQTGHFSLDEIEADLYESTTFGTQVDVGEEIAGAFVAPGDGGALGVG